MLPRHFHILLVGVSAQSDAALKAQAAMPAFHQDGI
jgi:hypothetical protein